MRWLGIDGGGTKTAFTVYDETLRMQARRILPTCHYAQVGFDGCAQVLREGIAWAEATGRLGANFGIGFGLCGYGEVAQDTKRLDQLVAELAAGRPYALANDVEAAWAAGLDLADGVVVIAGTGSIAYGVCNGRTRRCGGWDFELGDEGSAGWLGKQLLFAFTRESDGRAPAGPLLRLVRDELGLQDDFDLIDFARKHMADRSRISALAPLVARAAEAGDVCARSILETAAREEAAMVEAIVRDLFGVTMPERDATVRGNRAEGTAAHEDAADGTTVGDDTVDSSATGTSVAADIPVAYVGGTFKAGALILDPLAAALPERCRLVPPAHEPDLGAVLILRARLAQRETSPL